MNDSERLQLFRGACFPCRLDETVLVIKGTEDLVRLHTFFILLHDEIKEMMRRKIIISDCLIKTITHVKLQICKKSCK